MADPQLGALAQAETGAPAAGGAPGAESTGDQAANQPPQAANVCAVTAVDAPLGIPVLQSGQDADGDPIKLLAASQPASGGVTLNPDGTVTFTPVEPGLQSFRYEIGDGQGGQDGANVSVFVNPRGGELEQPVLTGIADPQLAEIARACAAAVALREVPLAGPEVLVRTPQPGTRIEVETEPGQSIHLASPDFINASYLVVEGGLLVLTEDGRQVFLSDFVDSAESGTPPTLAVAGGPAVGTDQLLANLQPISEPAEGPVVGRLPQPEVGPQHGGGAGFSPYDPGNIGPGIEATGPLAPTELGFGGEFLLRGTGEFGGGRDDDDGEPPTPPLDNEAPAFSATSTIDRELGEVTVTPQFASAGPFPELQETVRLPDDQINGVDQRNLTLGQSGDAAIIFNSEFASFVDTLGVFLIDPNGQMVDPQIVFPEIEQAQADPNFPFIHPGGGPLTEGDQKLLSDLYDPSELQPGQEFGLFLIAQGFTLNGADLAGELHFASDGHTLLTADGQALAGNVFFTTDPTPGSPNENPLNPDGLGHVVSGLEPDNSGLTIGFEDKLLSQIGGDNDFNDVLIDVSLSPTVQAGFAGGAIHVILNPMVSDPDDANLSRATVELLSGEPGDALTFEGSLPAGVELVTSTASSLVFEGTASIPDYLQILQGVVLDSAPVEGVRQVGITVVDGHGAASDPFVVNINLSGADAQVGTAGDDVLSGEPLVDDAISGAAGDDVLFGDSGNDLLDGGTGNDILSGGEGDDQLIGGPGVDLLGGGSGADSHIYSSLAERGDEITGFNANQGDALDFSQLLQGATGSTIDSFVEFASSGANVDVSVDVDGAGTDFAAVPFVTLIDPTGVTTGDGAAQAAVNSGALVV